MYAIARYMLSPLASPSVRHTGRSVKNG